MNSQFGQMLKLWRQRLGFSQLDLSLLADISAKHISFLETGRSSPTHDSVARLARALSLSPLDTNLLLRHAGLEAETQETTSRVEAALQAILDKHEPYPGAISDYSLMPQKLNRSALMMLDWLGIDIASFSTIVDLIFSPDGFRQFISNWDEMARITIRLTKMKAMAMEGDELFEQNFNKLLANKEFAKLWKEEEHYVGNTEPIIPVEVSAHGVQLSWFVVLSTFGTPRNVSLDEYQMEFFYPADDQTKQFAEEHLQPA